MLICGAAALKSGGKKNPDSILYSRVEKLDSATDQTVFIPISRYFFLHTGCGAFRCGVVRRRKAPHASGDDVDELLQSQWTTLFNDIAQTDFLNIKIAVNVEF